MSDTLQLKLQPEPDATVVGADTLQVRITYHKSLEENGEGSPGAKVIHLNGEGRGETQLAPVDLDEKVTAILENKQGLELKDLGEVKTSAAREGQPVVHILPSQMLNAMAERKQPPKQHHFKRSGYFVSLGSPNRTYSDFSLSFDLIDSDEKKAALRSLLGRDEGSELVNSAARIPKDATTVGRLGTLNLSGADLKFDGAFHIDCPLEGEPQGWAWVLNGPDLFIGFRSDPPLEKARDALRIMLPWEEAADKPKPEDCADCHESKSTPLDVDEENLLNSPKTFSDDPGSYCRPFSNPARILGERRFHTVFRVEQPEIEATSATQPNYGLLHPKDQNDEATAFRAMHLTNNAMVAKGTTNRAGLSLLTNNGLGRFFNKDLKIKLPPMSAIDFLPLPKLPWFNRREPVSADNPIDWDGNASRYQALSVAGGHIMEWRVQWRSNGYSLGDVAHTLTLAPRQTRRIVKLDWKRREDSERHEATRFDEEVAQSTFRERDYSDAVRSNLNEWSKGGSSSKTTSAAGGLGFVTDGFVIGGGAAHGNAQSTSWQDGGRTVSASEEQTLRDAIRQYGDSLRQFESTVVNEVNQEEAVQGVSEVVRNPNYCHSLTVIYHEILRHLRVDTVLSGVRECLFVPFTIRPFTVERVARWRSVFERHLKKRELRWALKYADDVVNDWQDSTLPDKPRVKQKLESLTGSLYIKLGIERPKEEVVSDEIDEQLDAEGSVGERVTTRVWKQFSPLLPISIGEIVSTLREYSPAQRDAYFQGEIAPAMARRWVDSLMIETKDGTVLEGADFTLVSEYRFNRTVRVDFYIPVDEQTEGDEGLTREDIEAIVLKATSGLPLGSVANVTSATLDFRASHYGRRVRSPRRHDDLITPPRRNADGFETTTNTESATLQFPASAWERRNMRNEAEQALGKIVNHVTDDLHHYHKVIWWTMDRDELYMLLDGFAISDSDRRSIASVVEREPIGIAGNSLVFRVSAGAFLGINGHETPEELLNYYKAEQAPSHPMRVSLPTDGLYAQAIMDQCNACEEHEGSTDWVLNDEDPALAEFPNGLFSSRQQKPQNTTPTNMPDSIINLQNAPAAPAPQGYGDLMNVLGNSGAFADRTGLEGTQQNARAAMDTASQLAGQFGGLALQSHLANLEAEKNAGKNFDKKRAAIDRAVERGSLSKEDGEAALREAAREMGGQQRAKGMSDNSRQIIDTFGKDRDVSVSETTPAGRSSATVKQPENKHRDPLEGAVAGDGAMAAPHNRNRISKDDPLDHEAIFAHRYLQVPEGELRRDLFPDNQPAGDRVSEAERQRSFGRPFFVSAGTLESDSASPSRASPEEIELLSYLIYDFPVGSSEISREDIAPLRDLLIRRARALEARNIYLELQILGTADSTGPDDVNATLRRERAEAVAKALRSTAYKMSYVGTSGSRLQGDETEFKRATNRSVTVRETARAYYQPPISRKGRTIEDLTRRVKEKLEVQAQNGDRDADIGLTIMEIYENNGSLPILHADKVREYYDEYAWQLARRVENPYYDASAFFIDGRAWIRHNLRYAPSEAVLHDLDASADDVIILIKLLAEAVYEGINMHVQYQAMDTADNTTDAWDMMSREINQQKDASNTVYNKAFDKYKDALKGPDLVF